MKPTVQISEFAYVNLILSYSRGIIAKLEEQAVAATRQNLSMDVVWLTRAGKVNGETPSGLIIQDVGCGSRLASRVRQMKEVRKLARRYSGVLLRYPLCDPITFVALSTLQNVASEHHTKEVPELQVNRDPRVITEKLFGPRFLRSFSAQFAVTEEILEYEQHRSGCKREGFLVYNGISTQRFPESARSSPLFAFPKVLKMVIASPTFPTWHGLDLILENFMQFSATSELHICGEVPAALVARAKAIPNVTIHGNLEPAQLLKVYSQCDVGLASFALHRKCLAQATSLKVREYLACGLPVILGHDDPGIPDAFPYVLRLQQFNVATIIDWCRKLQPVSRGAVFQAAEPFISVDRVVSAQVAGLRKISAGTVTRLNKS